MQDEPSDPSYTSGSVLLQYEKNAFTQFRFRPGEKKFKAELQVCETAIEENTSSVVRCCNISWVDWRLPSATMDCYREFEKLLKD